MIDFINHNLSIIENRNLLFGMFLSIINGLISKK